MSDQQDGFSSEIIDFCITDSKHEACNELRGHGMLNGSGSMVFCATAPKATHLPLSFGARPSFGLSLFFRVSFTFVLPAKFRTKGIDLPYIKRKAAAAGVHNTLRTMGEAVQFLVFRHLIHCVKPFHSIE